MCIYIYSAITHVHIHEPCMLFHSVLTKIAVCSNGVIDAKTLENPAEELQISLGKPWQIPRSNAFNSSFSSSNFCSHLGIQSNWIPYMLSCPLMGKCNCQLDPFCSIYMYILHFRPGLGGADSFETCSTSQRSGSLLAFQRLSRPGTAPVPAYWDEQFLVMVGCIPIHGSCHHAYSRLEAQQHSKRSDAVCLLPWHGHGMFPTKAPNGSKPNGDATARLLAQAPVRLLPLLPLRWTYCPGHQSDPRFPGAIRSTMVHPSPFSMAAEMAISMGK